jgi:glycosyltransferase involved in cell wall biosynthesis
MNILLINHYAGSKMHGMEYRPYYLAREWVKSGNKTTIICASFSHVRTVQPKFKGLFYKESIEGIDYIWFKTPKYSGNGFKRFVNMLSFVFGLFLKIGYIKNNVKPDVVIASSTYPLDIFPARVISKRSKASLIFEVHDLWPLSPMILGGMSKYHPFILLMQFAENCACKWADKIVSILPLAKEHFIEHGMKTDKFVHIPNGIVVEEWVDKVNFLPEVHNNEIKRLREEGKFLICYAGAHGLANSLKSFVESAKLVEDKNIHLLLVGDGPEKQNLLTFAEKEKIRNISFLPSVPKNAIPALLQSVDVLFFSLQKCSLFKYGISPNKLIDYMMAGKPIISAVEAGNDMVSETGCGITVEPGDKYAYAESMQKLSLLSEVERKKIGLRGKNYILENHDYNVLSKKFLNEIKTLTFQG